MPQFEEPTRDIPIRQQNGIMNLAQFRAALIDAETSIKEKESLRQDDKFNDMMEIMNGLARRHFDPSLPFDEQKDIDYSELLHEAGGRIPIIKRYKGYWPLRRYYRALLPPKKRTTRGLGLKCYVDLRCTSRPRPRRAHNNDTKAILDRIWAMPGPPTPPVAGPSRLPQTEDDALATLVDGLEHYDHLWSDPSDEEPEIGDAAAVEEEPIRECDEGGRINGVLEGHVRVDGTVDWAVADIDDSDPLDLFAIYTDSDDEIDTFSPRHYRPPHQHYTMPAAVPSVPSFTPTQPGIVSPRWTTFTPSRSILAPAGSFPSRQHSTASSVPSTQSSSTTLVYVSSPSGSTTPSKKRS
ncbi:hypothetical protein PUNSTDRAFT_135926 [Punctularia strigosozonata HHB-11173 SS5]|uniref:uncharacterized protein n=1 Tax=Punctularia strigosozonata (strain HHB-11173) TaxID=741275 RepID=UPI0004417377|nr:uncharacterized protein PUNSTDRAFT_135926 [Punctularia strigosozonata HHB-11173 SS5]EIN07240.1 hypothetical protein PUNSTDRAFT_135926 [Punctularia strigosozonata HHB-11173 SS5]